MIPVLQVGDRTLTTTDLLPLLIRYQLLPQFCREVLIDQAIAAVECSAEETEQALQAFDADHQITDDDARQDWLMRHSMTPETLADLVTRPLCIEKFKQQSWGNKLEAYFLTRKAQFDQVVYSLIRNTDPGIIQELYFRIRAGEGTFDELAQQYSQGPEGETEGRLGPVPLTQPHPTLAAQLAKNKPGYLFPPTRLGEWYVIIRLEKLIPAQLDPPTRQKLLDELFETWLLEHQSQPQPLPASPVPLAVASA